jgi:SAM-dependent methyltransferase
MQDLWASGDPYEDFMGRWSQLVASNFLRWLDPSLGSRWIDVGCGTGALSAAVLSICEPAALTALDQSPAFVAAAAERLSQPAECRVGDALAIPLSDYAVDYAVSGLMLNFISDPVGALAEMRRVTVPGGVVSVYVWDYAGRMEFLQHFWRAVMTVDPDAGRLDEARRFPDSTAAAIAQQFASAGLFDVDSVALEIDTHFRDFDDYWHPMLGGQGPAPTYAMSLDETTRHRLRAALESSLPVDADGSIRLRARAWGVRGTT